MKSCIHEFHIFKNEQVIDRDIGPIIKSYYICRICGFLEKYIDDNTNGYRELKE